MTLKEKATSIVRDYLKGRLKDWYELEEAILDALVEVENRAKNKE